MWHRTLATWWLLSLLLLAVNSQLTDGTSPSSFNYPYTTILNLTNQAVRSGSVQAKFPWPILMHGQIYYSTLVRSDSYLVFGNLSMRIGYSANNVMTSLSVFNTDSNFTMLYGGTDGNNASIGWAITFFKDGYQKFVLQINGNTSGEYRFCEWAGCYQNMTLTPTIYSQCSVGSCRSNEELCLDEASCRSNYADCFGTGVASCINEVAFYIAITVIMATLFGIFMIIFVVRRCRAIGGGCCGGLCGAIANCCSNIRQCCCRCPIRRRASEDYADPPAPAGPVVVEIGVMRRESVAIELTELHHPHTDEQLRRLECAICIQPRVDIMTQCEHYFHWSCLEDWLARKSDCPNCRAHLSRKYYQACMGCGQFYLPANVMGRVSGGLVCLKCKGRGAVGLDATNQYLGNAYPLEL